MRKNRRSRSRSRRQRGGADESLRQGAEYLAMRGGGLLTGAPIGHTGMLEDGLRAQARVGELDAHVAAARAQGPDQVGGRRNRRNARNSRKSRKSKKSRNARKSRKSRKSRNARKSCNSRKSKKSRKSRKSKKSRKSQRGGAMQRHLEGADYNSSPMLLNDYSKAGLPSFKVL